MFKLKKINNINEIIFVWYIFSFLAFLPISILFGENCYRICFILNILIISIISLLYNKKIFLKKDIILLIFTVVIFGIDFLFRKNTYTIETYVEFFKKCYIPCYFFNRIKNIRNVMKYLSIFSKVAIIVFLFDPIFNYHFLVSYMGYGFSVVLPGFLAIYIYHFISKKNTDIIFLIISFVATFLYGNRSCLLSIILMLFLTIKLIINEIKKNKKQKIEKKEINNNNKQHRLKEYGILVVAFVISFGINYLTTFDFSTIDFYKILNIAQNQSDTILKEDYPKISFKSYSLRHYEQVIDGNYEKIFSGRVEIYEEAINVIREIYSNKKADLFFGKGAGYFRSLNNGTYTHSIIFDLIIEYGIIGTILFACLFLYCFIRWFKESKKYNFLFGAYLLCLCFPKLLLSVYFQKETYLWLFIVYILSYFTFPKKYDEKKTFLLNQGKNKNMKIFMLLDNCFDPDVRVYKEATYLVNNGNDVEILCLDKKNKYKDKPIEEINKIKIKRFFSRTDKTTKLIEKNFIIRKLKYIIYFWWLIKFFVQIKSYLKDKEYQILHCHDLTMAFFACLFFKNKDIVFDMHEYYVNKKSKIANLFIKLLVNITQKKSKWIIYVNNFQMNNKYKNKFVYIPNYPLEEDYLPIEKEKIDKIRINYVGCLRDYESLKTLMKIVDTNDEIEVGLYGFGDCYERLLKENNSKFVTIYGKFNGKSDSSKIYRNTDILYCVYNPENSNWRNSYPVKLYESIITNTPVIVAENSKAGEFVKENKIGETVEYNNIVSLQNAVQNINLNYEEYVKNIEKIRKKYRWEDIVNNLNIIYK